MKGLPSVVKLLSKRWWISIGAKLEGPKLEPEGPRAEVGFPTADQGFCEHSRHSVWLLWHSNGYLMLAASIYTKHGQMQNDKITAKVYIFFTKHHAYRKLLKYKLCRVVDSSKRCRSISIMEYRICY